jgi:cell division protein ZapA
MPQVSISIANRIYELACGEGEQDRVQELAAYVDEKVSARPAPSAPGKLVVFAALLLVRKVAKRGMAWQAETARVGHHAPRPWRLRSRT